ncbi:AraC family ligand binding domain-containing protein [Gracilibacillus sp. JCM 18860]|uniref:AraC family ligand binding domain-containing protein n=1 Tax=Gracilibacillus sp. JCM 18860 TaxID=1306159 RepID=UPI0032607187
MRIESSLYMEEEEFPFWIDHTVHTTRNTPPIHAHDFIELVYVTEGEAEHLFEGGEHYPLSKGGMSSSLILGKYTPIKSNQIVN